MPLEYLRLINFRNFANREITIPPEGLILAGANGAGKTSLLETLVFLNFFSTTVSNTSGSPGLAYGKIALK